MSFDKVLVTKEYVHNLVDKHHEIVEWKVLMNDDAYYNIKTNDQFLPPTIEHPSDLKKVLNERYIEDCSNYNGKKCIVIGNGGSVIESERGKEIDKFDLIVRNNLARCESFEKYVGSRTDVRFMSHKTFGNILMTDEYSSYDKDYVPTSRKHHLIIRSAGNIGSIVPGFLLNINGGDNVFSILDLDYNLHLDRLASSNHFCTVGFSAVLTMMDLGCDVYIYGMDFYNPDKKFHYFEENSEKIKGSRNHSIRQEASYIEYLLNAGKIKEF